jgi:hypothetical protein
MHEFGLSMYFSYDGNILLTTYVQQNNAYIFSQIQQLANFTKPIKKIMNIYITKYMSIYSPWNIICWLFVYKIG